MLRGSSQLRSRLSLIQTYVFSHRSCVYAWRDFSTPVYAKCACTYGDQHQDGLCHSVRYFAKEASKSKKFVMNVPGMGDSITEGTISEWKKQIGDIIAEDEVVCVIDTDKVSVDIHAQASGKILSLAAAQGETVLVGGELLSIDTSYAEVSNKKSKKKTPQTKTETPSNDDTTPVHKEDEQTLHIYSPTIRFRYGLNRPHTRPQVEKPTDSKHPGGHFFSDFSQLPERFKVPPEYSESEIETINTGISPNQEEISGVWKSVITRT